MDMWATDRGIPKGGGLPGCRPPPTKGPRTEIKKNLVDIVISNVLRDFTFSRNQPLKSADGCYIRIFKNKVMKLKRKEYRTLTMSWNV
jgi:hypothetical protein